MNTSDIAAVALFGVLLQIYWPIQSLRCVSLVCSAGCGILSGIWFRNLISVWIGITIGLAVAGLRGYVCHYLLLRKQ